MGVGYSVESFQNFLISLRNTGSKADVVIARASTDHMPISLMRVVHDCGATLQVFHRNLSSLGLDYQRNLLAAQYLGEHIARYRCGRVLFVDFRDLYFQRDPFDQPIDYEFPIHVSAEALRPHAPIRLGTEGYNRGWLEACWSASRASLAHSLSFARSRGSSFVQQVRDEPVLNCGSIIGHADAMLRLFKVRVPPLPLLVTCVFACVCVVAT